MRRLWIGVPLALLLTVMVPVAARAQCGAMDVVFVFDTTGSMGGALDNVKAESAEILNQIEAESGGDYQLGLVTFKDDVRVDEDLAPGNKASVEAKIQALFVSGGSGIPEASDEALNTVVNGLDAADRPPGAQTGDFNGTFRAGAVKIIVIVTDALPGGFDDAFTPGVDDANAHQRAVEAAGLGIRISAVWVPTGSDEGRPMMEDYAATTGGLFFETDPDGTGTAEAFRLTIAACGGGTGGEGNTSIRFPRPLFTAGPPGKRYKVIMFGIVRSDDPRCRNGRTVEALVNGKVKKATISDAEGDFIIIFKLRRIRVGRVRVLESIVAGYGGSFRCPPEQSRNWPLHPPGKKGRQAVGQ